MLIIDSNPSAETLSQHLSLSGGITLCARNLAQISLSCSKLRAIDLYNCLSLTEFSLEQAFSEIHISIQGCPNLRVITLPLGCTAIVHLDTGEHLPTLKVIGSMSCVDACWIEGERLKTFKYKALKEPLINGAWIGEVSTYQNVGSSSGAYPTAELCVFVGTCNDQVSKTTLSLPDSSRLALFSHMDYLEDLSLNGSNLDYLEISGATRLNVLDIGSLKVGDLTIANSVNLKEIKGRDSVNELHVRDTSGAKSGLVVDTKLGELYLIDSPVKCLKIKHPADINLIRCSALKDVEFATGSTWICEGRIPSQLIGKSRVIINETLLKNLQERVLGGNLDAWPEFKSILPLASGTKQLPQILMTLKSLLGSKITLEEIWQARCELYTRHHLPQHFKASKPLTPAVIEQAMFTWRWQFPSDLGLDAWRADFEIWRGCWQLEAQKGCAVSMLDELSSHPPCGSAILDANWLVGTQLSESNKPNHASVLAFMKDVYSVCLERNNKELSRMMIEISHLVIRMCNSAQIDVSSLVESAKMLLLRHSTYQDILRLFAVEIRQNPVIARSEIVQLAANPPQTDCVQTMSVGEFRSAAMALALSGSETLKASLPRVLVT